MQRADVIVRYKNKKCTIAYAMAQTRDEQFAFFFKKETKDTDTNRWLSSITTFAKNKNLHEIDQKEFLDQFTVCDEMGRTTYIHKCDNNVKFTISS
jgi:hypothetical protein